MPERSKAVYRVAEALIEEGGGSVRRDMLNVPASARLADGEYVASDEFLERFIDPIERLWEVAVDSIDFNVVLLTAQGRHLALDHDEEEEDDSLGLAVHGVCGECLREALMLGNTMSPEWKDQPKVPRGGYGSARDY